MLQGKRPRPPIKRTTSMTGITVVDPSHVEPQSETAALEPGLSFLAMVSPRRYHGQEFAETAHFLRSCGLCQRRLAPGRDIYMYRGDTGFCSVECREEQMKQDETKEKLSIMPSKQGDHQKSPNASTKTQTAVAA